jgi:hypothetical protein
VLRFGIICGDTTLAAWQMQTIDHLRAMDDVRAALLIIEEQGVSPRKEPPALWRWYAALYLKQRAPLDTSTSVATYLSGIPTLHATREPSGAFRSADVAAIRAYDLDFILDFGMAATTGDLAQTPRYGVWSFAVDGDDAEGGSPPCFWAVYAGAPTLGVALQRLSGGRDGHTTLRRGDFKNFPYSYRHTVAHMRSGVTQWPAQVCGEIQRGETAPPLNVPATPLSPRKTATNGRVAGFLVRLAWRFARMVGAGLFRHDQWNIGIVAAPIETFLVAGARPPVRWLPKPARNHFLADPFPASDDALFAEAFDYRTRKGTIAVLTKGDDGFYSTPQTVMELPVHLSYPYLIDHQGESYCVPETGEAGEIALYKATAFPHQWMKYRTLVAGFAGLDATPFLHDGRWWLLCTEQGPFSNTMLHAWYAADLFGPWTPHPGNPLKADVRSSRPAGRPFIHDGQLYRPAQDCSRTYGGAVVINRVLRLSPTAFAEETVAVVAPYADSPYRYGVHTLSTFGQQTVIDGKGRAFAPAELRRIVGTLFRKAARRVFRKP